MAVRNVSVIPATRRTGSNNSTRTAVNKLRVAAYCRVSTDDEEQLTSYAAQVNHYTVLYRKMMSGSLGAYTQMKLYLQPTPRSV